VAGTEPFTDWLGSLDDRRMQARLRMRIRRLESGLFGDGVALGGGLFELREHTGGGLRVYFGRHGQTVVILLCGGIKRSQAADINRARKYWIDWKSRQS
jgi:putative addiction module killer protein